MAERTLTPKWLSLALTGAICACIASIVADALTVRRIRQLGAPEPGGVFTQLSGVSAKGQWTSATAERRCHLVRFASDLCPFSRSDDRAFRAFEARLLRGGCDSAILAPASNVFPTGYIDSDTRRLLQYADLGFLKQAKFIRTPTTLLFDQDWRLMWRREGVLSKSDLRTQFDLRDYSR